MSYSGEVSYGGGEVIHSSEPVMADPMGGSEEPPMPVENNAAPAGNAAPEANNAAPAGDAPAGAAAPAPQA